MANYTQAAATIQVKVGAGKLFGIFVSASSSGTLTIYDSGAANTGDPLISNTITVAAGSQYLSFPAGIFFNKGLYVVLGGSSAAFTVVYD
jgi:hypothetical protein